VEEKRNYKRRRKRQQRERQIKIACMILVVLAVIGTSLIIKSCTTGKKENTKNTNTVETAANPKKKEDNTKEKENQRQQLLAQANQIAAGYDYDSAVALLQSYDGYENYTELTDAIASYNEQKAACVPINVEEVTHIFYHSLVVDPDRAFANQDSDHQAKGNNQWMTTIDEFNKITQAMYDEGYVLVNLHDIAQETVDENGAVHFSPGTILLPPGKKAYVLSIDDLSYYHCYENYGFASKIVLDENGKPKCEYIQADGTTVVGDYDVVPLLDKFMEEHPDGAYHGARGTIALTGYNGILGYRTDISYQTRPADLYKDKVKWLENHPEFNLDQERSEAKKVADAMKAEGWSFASHTWGHLKVASISLEQLQADTTRWKENVEPLVGNTDVIIFAHGEDLGDWNDYDQNNPKFQYLKSQGYNFFCNVDSREYGVQIRDNYVRQTRRNIDGYRLYQNVIGKENNLSDLFNAADIIDSKRPPVLPLG